MGLRDELLGAQPEVKEVTIKGAVYRLRKPTVAERSKVYELAGLDGADAKSVKVNLGRLQTAALIAMLVDEKGAAVFSDADFDALLGCPVGSATDKLGSAAAGLLNEGEG